MLFKCYCTHTLEILVSQDCLSYDVAVDLVHYADHCNVVVSFGGWNNELRGHSKFIW